MKTKFMKRTISLVLLITTLVSVMAIGLTSASAFSIKKDSYFFNIYMSEGEGNSSGQFEILPICGNSVTRGATKSANRQPSQVLRVNFNDLYSSYGITGVALKMCDDDSMYVEKIEGWSVEHPEVVTIYAGQWVTSSNWVYFYPENDVYKATIKTSDSDNSGTDLFVDASIYTTKGSYTDVRLNELCSGDSFEKGSEHSFYIGTSSSGGTFERLKITLNKDSSTLVNLIDTTTASGWKLEKLSIEKVQGTVKEEPFTVTANQWYDSGDSSCYSNQSGKTSTYKVEVKTSDVKKAGTDATLNLSINGNKETVSLGYFADFYTSGNNFERKDKDEFQIAYPTSSNIGEIKTITITNKGNNAGPGWHLDYIKLTEILPDGVEGKTYTFDYDGWINADETVTLTNPSIS